MARHPTAKLPQMAGPLLPGQRRPAVVALGYDTQQPLCVGCGAQSWQPFALQEPQCRGCGATYPLITKKEL